MSLGMTVKVSLQRYSITPRHGDVKWEHLLIRSPPWVHISCCCRCTSTNECYLHAHSPSKFIILDRRRNKFEKMLKFSFLMPTLSLLVNLSQGKNLPPREVDPICIGLHCGLQSAACFADSECRQVNSFCCYLFYRKRFLMIVFF